MANRVKSLVVFLAQNGISGEEERTGEELIVEYRTGLCDFSRLLNKYHRLLVKKARTWIPGYTYEELYQEFALKLFMCCSKWKPEEDVSFTTYLYNSLENHLKYLIRSQTSFKRRVLYETENYGVNTYELDRLDVAGEDQGLRKTELEDFIQTLHLDPREIICVEMIKEGCIQKDVADKLNLSRSRITQIVHGLRPKFSPLLR